MWYVKVIFMHKFSGKSLHPFISQNAHLLPLSCYGTYQGSLVFQFSSQGQRPSHHVIWGWLSCALPRPLVRRSSDSWAEPDLRENREVGLRPTTVRMRLWWPLHVLLPLMSTVLCASSLTETRDFFGVYTRSAMIAYGNIWTSRHTNKPVFDALRALKKLPFQFKNYPGTSI